jgi:hypothetical protein
MHVIAVGSLHEFVGRQPREHLLPLRRIRRLHDKAGRCQIVFASGDALLRRHTCRERARRDDRQRG